MCFSLLEDPQGGLGSALWRLDDPSRGHLASSETGVKD